MLLQIGELAKRTGFTIRALRHYDEIGLLSPSVRSEGDYRLYNQTDIAKLYRIQALRRLDLSLAEIRSLLSDGAASLPEILTQQISSLDRQIHQASTLRATLVDLQEQLQSNQEPEIDHLLMALENMVISSKYFTDDELQKLKSLRKHASERGEIEKAELLAVLHDLMARGIPANDPKARSVATRWIELLLAEVGGDEGLLIKVFTMHWNESTLHSLSGIDQSGMKYIAQAMACSRLIIYTKYCLPEEIANMRKNYVEQTLSWPPLISAIREKMAQGASPESVEVQALAYRWKTLSAAKACGSSELQSKLQTAFQNEPELRLGSGIDVALTTFIHQAILAAEIKK